MGIINITPDSFSDGGLNASHGAAIAAGQAMVLAGATLLDIGGESTRPGATPVSPVEEQARILPVIEALALAGATVSVDTRNTTTMHAALDAGATIVNDVSALTHDPDAAPTVARRGCPVILMHMRGTPQTMLGLASYADVASEVAAELSLRIEAALAAGIAREVIAIDPGIGFAKTAAQNLELLRALPRLAALGFPLVVGVSRKGFIGTYGREPDPLRRAPGSIAAGLFAAAQGAAVLRVHDVAETVQALNVWRALSAAGV